MDPIGQIDPKEKNILLVLFTLILFGLIQVYSSSYIFAVDVYGDGLFFVRRQFFFVLLGCGLLLLVRKLPLAWIHRWGWTLWALSTLGLILTFVPGLGVKVGGAQRWVSMGFGFRFEPCELAKVSLPLMVASLSPSDRGPWSLGQSFLALVVLGTPLVLMLLQPDFGSFAICVMVLGTLFFVQGMSWRYIISGAFVTLPLFYFLIMDVPYRKARVLSFLDPFQSSQGGGFQLIQSMLSFHLGGWNGKGIGNGQGKLFFLPEAHTDFTLAVLGEELGFIGFFLLLLAYGYLIWRGFQLSFSLKEVRSQVLVLGLSLTFAYCVLINIGVTLGLLPTKGLTLPFLAYGGSSLVFNCFLFGLLLNLLSNHSGIRN